MTRRLAALLAVCLVSTVVSAEVYRWKDEDGNLIFSDSPQPGAEKIELKETTVVPALTPPRRTERKPAAPATSAYTAISITQPGAEETLRNMPTIQFAASLSPPLRTGRGHRVQFFLDGNATGKPLSSTTLTLDNVPRGEHRVEAAVIDADGRELLRSEPRTFFVHQTSIQHPPPANPGPR